MNGVKPGPLVPIFLCHALQPHFSSPPLLGKGLDAFGMRVACPTFRKVEQTVTHLGFMWRGALVFVTLPRGIRNSNFCDLFLGEIGEEERKVGEGQRELASQAFPIYFKVLSMPKDYILGCFARTHLTKAL